MAFLTRYRALRQAEAAESDEVEYNFGRAFQQLGEQGLSLIPFMIVLTVDIGLHSLAVKHYERVLEIAERRTRNNPDVCLPSLQ
jgi:general transcription factor 3C polypeptide 3 (transcription factor C subunit 4)